MSKDGINTGQSTIKKRRYHAKTRTGCLTCRIRRVKCDEGKPDCKKCTSTGRKCDGYDAIPSPQNASPEPPPSKSLSIVPCSTALEYRTFEWFRKRTVPVLSGHFGDETYDRTALQLYHAEPAVRHTVNAFGALHLETNSLIVARNEGIGATLRIALPHEQHSRALQEVRRLLVKEHVPIDVILVCSALLVQFEGFRDDFVPAMRHAEKAIALLSANFARIDDSLLRTMMRFDVQSATHSGRKSPRLITLASHLDKTLPPALSSSIQARHLVTTWAGRFYAFEQATADHYIDQPGDVRLHHLAEAQVLEMTFARLHELLCAFATRESAKLSVREHHGLQILQARATFLRIFAATCLYCEETMFDAYLDDFKKILDTCSRLLSDPKGDRRLFALHMDEGLMYPLYVVATYCRDSRIRRAALDVLRSLPEGNWTRIWHADVVMRTAQLIVEFEEAGRTELECGDVPEWRRVHNARFDHWDPASWHAKFGSPLRVRPNGIDGGWIDLHELIDMQSAERLIANQALIS